MSLSMRAASSMFGPTITMDPGGAAVDNPAGSLLERLAEALDATRVPYCQWKGHWTRHRWTAGQGDVDLLVDHDSRAECRQLLSDLGFKPALPPGPRQLPGVESYFGHDPSVPRLIHVHVHYRLLIGNFWRFTYRIPIEPAMLETAGAGSLFRVPDPTFQFVVFVLRMVLLQVGRPVVSVRTRWRRGIQIQLDNLEGLTEREALATVLRRHLPSIDLPFFDRCVATLRCESGPLERSLVPDLLHRRLRAHARRPSFAALLNAAIDKLLPPPIRRIIADERMQFAGGGNVIALVGGDGSGKSTSAAELTAWLGTQFATMRAHLGNPPRSLATLAAGGALKAEEAINRLLGRESGGASHLTLLRHLCTARDCYRLYERVQRFAVQGGIAICERYPVPEIRSHVGPRIPALLATRPTAFARFLRNAEVGYYELVLRPDQLFVLRIEPELAVLRKPEEPADYVRARGRAVCEADWTVTPAQVVDASRPFPDVLDDLKSLVWSAL
jgi:hypothetical protein